MAALQGALRTDLLGRHPGPRDRHPDRRDHLDHPAQLWARHARESRRQAHRTNSHGPQNHHLGRLQGALASRTTHHLARQDVRQGQPVHPADRAASLDRQCPAWPIAAGSWNQDWAGVRRESHQISCPYSTHW